MNFKHIFFVSVFSVFIFASCKSVPETKKLLDYIDYSNDDVVKNEKDRILNLLETEPVQALWRSYFLKDPEVTERCIDRINILTDKALDEKDYPELRRFVKSLESIGYRNEKISFKEADALFNENIPGSNTDRNLLPKDVNSCVNATVTVFVDKGIKVQGGMGYSDKTLGSGFFIDKRGYLITNYHVIAEMVDPKYEGYSRLYIKFSDDEDSKIPAKVIGYDSVMDLALIKAEITPDYVFELGSSKDMKVGDRVSVIGAPLGFSGSMTSGIISATDRKLLLLGPVFQIDAPVNSGNSGGPCIDSDYKVQAIVFAQILQSQGLNFVIPVEYLKQELPYLYSGGEFKHVWTGGYGHTFRNITRRDGLEIQYVMPGGSLSFAGFKDGDVIKYVDGKPVTTIENFQATMRSYGPGTVVNVTVVTQSGTEKAVPVYLEERPSDPAVKVFKSDLLCNSFLPLFGMELIPSSTESKKVYTVGKVLPSTAADDLFFSENDTLKIQDLTFDKTNEAIFCQIYSQRRKKGFLDVGMILATRYDSPYFF